VTFEERLATRLKSLPTKSLTEEIRNHVGEKLERRIRVSKQKYIRRRWGSIVAVVAAILITAVTLHSINLLPIGSEATRSNFDIVVASDTMVPTALDTTEFRSILQDYLERHSLSDESHSSTATAISGQPTKEYLPIINKVSDLAIRWSKIDAEKFGFAFVTYLGNDKPRIDAVIAVKNSAQMWSIISVSKFPVLTSKELSKFTIYPSEWGGNNITLNGQIAFEFMPGLFVNKSITNIKITAKKWIHNQSARY